MFSRKKLYTPGPTEIPPEVQAEMSQPMIHHRTSEFSEIFAKTREKLARVFQTQNDVMVLAGTGTGGMDASVSNFFSPGDHVLVVEAGKFGKRWAELAMTYHLNVTKLQYRPGEPTRPDDVARQLQRHPDITGVFVTASETSTATYHPVKEISEVIQERDDVLLVVDGVTAVGIHDIRTDEWGLDVVVAGSQKGFMLPPGLAFVSVSERAWERAKQSSLPKYYFDLTKERKNQSQQTTAYTPAVSLIRGCGKACDLMLRETLPKLFHRHTVMTKAVHAATKALNLELIAQDSPSHCLTAIAIPEKIGANNVKKVLDNDHFITVAGGQDELKGKIIRVAHFGALTPSDVRSFVQSFETTLTTLGAHIESGVGTVAMEDVFKANGF